MPVKKVVVFVHGWSVTNTDTYGGLPVRLREEARAAGLDIEIKEIFLGRYISFSDGVRIKDISTAFHAAVKDQLAGLVNDGLRFVCITHSTGGPVIRDWWRRYYTAEDSGICPMSHLIMLAPANYGSALAQLGKGRLSRLKFWFGGVEPGQGVLDWLELGSAEAWDLNSDWIHHGGTRIGPQGVFPFVLTGQYIDRAFYDHINTYTGEIGSDGVVRVVSAANLRGSYIKLVQETPRPGVGGEFAANNHDVMKGAPAILDQATGKEVRKALNGAQALGIRIVARPDHRFVHYLPCEFTASREMLDKALHRNSTTLVDIRLRRVVRKNVFRLAKMSSQTQPRPLDFKDTPPGDEIV